MSLIWRLIGPSRLIQYCFRTERWFDNAHTVARFKVMSTQDIIRAEAALWTLVSSSISPLRPHQLILIEEVFANGGLVASPDDHNYAALFMSERWFPNAHSVTRFKMSRKYITQSEAALWTLVSSCRSPLLPHQLKLIEEVFAHGGLVASPDDHDYATKLKRNVESCEYDLHIDKVLELASSLPAASPRMWNIVACMLDHCGREEHWNPQKHFQIMVGHITDEQCPSDVLSGIVEVLLVSRSKFHRSEKIHLPHKLRENVLSACAVRVEYASSSRHLDLLTGLVDMFVQWSE